MRRALSVALVALASCAEPTDAPPGAWTPNEYALIATLSPIPSPPASPSNAYADEPAAAALGRALFHDARLSVDGSLACASCHDPARAFTDGRSTALGLGLGERNTPSVLGVAHASFFAWDGRKDSLWSQALGPLESPAEMGAHRFDVARFVLAEYPREYAAVFGPAPALPDRDAELEVDLNWARLSCGERERVTRVFANTGKAIEAFERTLTHEETPFDRYVAALARGEHDGGGHLSAAALRGLDAFLGSAGCVHCHNGPLLTDQAFHRLDLPGAEGSGRARGLELLLDDPFRSDGRFSDGVTPDFDYLDRAPTDATGAFKTPSLRGVARTAPYGHAGQFATLEEVLEHYRALPTRPVDAEIDPVLRQIDPSFDVADMVALLESLNGD